jgi:hypothetical protein
LHGLVFLGSAQGGTERDLEPSYTETERRWREEEAGWMRLAQMPSLWALSTAGAFCKIFIRFIFSKASESFVGPCTNLDRCVHAFKITIRFKAFFDDFPLRISTKWPLGLACRW